MRQVAGLGVSDQTMINHRQCVAEGLEALPHRHLVSGRQLFKPTRFDSDDQFGELIFESIEGQVDWRALVALSCGCVPELHASIVFETVFYNKQFSQENKGKQDRAYTGPPNSTRAKPIPHHHSPLLPLFLCAPPELGSRLAVSHPKGLALTPAGRRHTVAAGSR